MNRKSLLRRIPWKIVLPVLMLLATLVLLRLDEICVRKAHGVDDMPVSTAWGLICLLNWPAIPLTDLLWKLRLMRNWEYINWERLAIGLTCWACIGSLLDRRIAGVVTPVVSSKRMRISLYLLGFSIALFILGLGVLFLIGDLPMWFDLRDVIRSRWIYVMGRQVNRLGALVWGFVGTFYFGIRLLRSRSRHLASTT